MIEIHETGDGYAGSIELVSGWRIESIGVTDCPLKLAARLAAMARWALNPGTIEFPAIN